jgi:hypothetical protein
MAGYVSRKLTLAIAESSGVGEALKKNKKN